MTDSFTSDDEGENTTVLSVVVPVLDEARIIERTLRHLTAQEAVDEVIVVDNGSTDGTVAIVRDFADAHPKVELLLEPRRGIAAARNAGFDKARGTIIARTDADTIVDPEWGRTIREFLADNPGTAAVTGLCTYHDSPVGFLLEFGQWALLRTGRIGGQVGNMYGPNMAVRREAWLRVGPDTQVRADVAEDLDLALCLGKKGFRIDQVPAMRARTSARRRRTSPLLHWRFHLTGLRTLRDQGIPVHPVHRVIIVAAWLGHTIQWPIYRFWDFHRRRFTLRPGDARISSVG
ncbi:glycosyltransferase involved in cell wall biosynthesis [Nocardia transvalensis]|uniref:Glycosyltransferase involved in cell wall biosynthesis n=1 Tax=Nocardia transvalensis TaxID=37333 RepID=A0A7W9UL47_9NOCA|nr:glycosyltransferase [Nocardia transvalensis]MBB5917193.1 glycosyltransferase involved in cell wall biosynthesis [Nocardia transvalensis]